MPGIRRGVPAPNQTTTHKKSGQVIVQDPASVLKRYSIWHEAENHSRSTESCYERTLMPFFTYLKDEQDITDLTKVELDHLRAWLVWLRNTPSRLMTVAIWLPIRSIRYREIMENS
jgi:site-specific recombinase XerD